MAGGGEIRDVVEQVRGVLPSLDRRGRAQLVLEMNRAVYDWVKFREPEGAGMDGRDGPERDALAAVGDAAEQWWTAVLLAGTGGGDAGSPARGG